MTRYIDKSKTGRENLVELIKDSVASGSDVDVSYIKSSISNTGIAGANTSVTVDISSGGSTTTVDMGYERPSLDDSTADENVFQFTVEEVISPSFDDLLEERVSDRLSIPKDNFTIRDLAVNADGTGSFMLSARKQAETIVSEKRFSILFRLKRFTVYDTDGALGIGTPENKLVGDKQEYYKGSSTGVDVLKRFILSRVYARPASKDLIDSTELSIVAPYGNPISLGIGPYKTLYVRALFKEKSMWVYNGTYSIRRLCLNTDLPGVKRFESTDGKLNADIGNLVLSGTRVAAELDGDIAPSQYQHLLSKENTLVPVDIEHDGRRAFAFLMYPNREYAQTELTKSEYIDIENIIKKELAERYFIPAGAILLQSRLSEYRQDTDKLNISRITLLIPEMSICGVYTEAPKAEIDKKRYDVVTIFLIFSKKTQCQFLSLREIAGNRNHIGFLEGISDGFKIGDAEWWEVDAGRIKDQNGNVIWDKETAIGSNGAYSEREFQNQCFIEKYTGKDGVEREYVVTRSGRYETTFELSQRRVLDPKIPIYSLPNGDMCSPWNTGTGKYEWIQPPVGPGNNQGHWHGHTDITPQPPRKIDDVVTKPQSDGQYLTLDLSDIKNKEINGFSL